MLDNKDDNIETRSVSELVGYENLPEANYGSYSDISDIQGRICEIDDMLNDLHIQYDYEYNTEIGEQIQKLEAERRELVAKTLR